MRLYCTPITEKVLMIDISYGLLYVVEFICLSGGIFLLYPYTLPHNIPDIPTHKPSSYKWCPIYDKVDIIVGFSTKPLKDTLDSYLINSHKRENSTLYSHRLSIAFPFIPPRK